MNRLLQTMATLPVTKHKDMACKVFFKTSKDNLNGMN